MGLSPAAWEAVRLSVGVSVVGVLVSLPFGIALGWLLARKSFFGKPLVETAINLPLVLPPVVTGYALLVMFGSNGPLGRFLHSSLGLDIAFTWKGAALASAIVAFPLMARSIRIAVTAVDERLEGMARTLGATRWNTFTRVTLPLARHGVIAGAILAFARGLGEFGATIMIAGSIPGETRTVPLFIYEALESPGGAESVVGVIVVSVLISAGALLVSEYLLKLEERRLGRRSPWD